MKLLVFLHLLILFVSSCSSKEEDYKDAVSVFNFSREVQLDDSKKESKVEVPMQKHNKFWFGSNKATHDMDIENFAFASKISKKKTIWSGFRTGNDDNKVFKPLIVDSLIYILDAKGNLIARDLATFKKVWKKRIFDKKINKDFKNGKIYYNEGKIFATSGFNYLAAIDAKNGDVIWSKKIGSIPISTPVASSSQVFVITVDNETYALDVNTGRINWIHEGINKNTAIVGAADPVFYKNYVISSYSSGEIYILNQKNSEVGWSYSLNVNRAINSDFILNDVDATPVVKDDVVFAVGNGGKMMAIQAINGNIIWRREIASISDFWIAGDYVYVVNNDNQLMSLDIKDGGVKWYQNLDKEKNVKKRAIYNGVVMAGDNLVLSNSKREIVLVSPIDGTILQRKKVGKEINHTPIIVDKKIYLNTLGRFTVDVVVME